MQADIGSADVPEGLRVDAAAHLDGDLLAVADSGAAASDASIDLRPGGERRRRAGCGEDAVHGGVYGTMLQAAPLAARDGEGARSRVEGDRRSLPALAPIALPHDKSKRLRLVEKALRSLFVETDISEALDPFSADWMLLDAIARDDPPDGVAALAERRLDTADLTDAHVIGAQRRRIGEVATDSPAGWPQSGQPGAHASVSG